ncbi:hypothetical protein HYD57_00905 [Mycoplasmopsis bovis]|nr:hypothetical protein [Mycoplasmopsis bovis]QQH66272.1 hypothetical protein HYD57_00905 [Mycoplasmopsis bovis]
MLTFVKISKPVGRDFCQDTQSGDIKRADLLEFRLLLTELLLFKYNGSVLLEAMKLLSKSVLSASCAILTIM